MSTDVELSVLIVGIDRMRTLNREYRSIDSSTDVLSFPQYDRSAMAIANVPLALGDIVICWPVVLRHCRTYGLSLREELAALLVHSMLHLLGWDHEVPAQAQEMAELEMSVLAAIGVVPLAALVGRSLC